MSFVPSAATDPILNAREWVATAQSVAVLTGAGISAESGLPTFRGPGGLWRNYRPEQLATPEAFARDPQTVWEWYDWRRSVHAGAEPNAGHRALAALERAKNEFLLITQNVDSLHERAGSRAVVHLHGSLWRVRCLACGREEANEQVPLAPLPPRCACGGMQRPAVVWFGESLPGREFQAALAAARHVEVFLVVGTSSLVYPAAALPRVALESGARVIEVNPEATELTGSAHASLRGLAGEILPQIVGVHSQ
jgi:NAD-dependent deacetylase